MPLSGDELNRRKVSIFSVNVNPYFIAMCLFLVINRSSFPIGVSLGGLLLKFFDGVF